MIKCSLTTIGAAVMLYVVAGSVAQDDEQLLQDFRKTIQANGVVSTDVYDTNGFHVVSEQAKELGADLKPDGPQMQILSVAATGVFQTTIEKGRPTWAGGGVAIFHRASGVPMLSVVDADGDGVLDGLSYSRLDENGKIVLTVVDYEADGQADLRLNLANHSNEIWYADRWYTIEKQDDRRGIILNGEFVALRIENNRFLVP